MKTTIVFHIFIDNDASSVEKYKACLTRKQYLIDMRKKIIKQSMYNVSFFFYKVAILLGYILKIEP